MSVSRRLAIVTTHPVQYNAPWFRQLAEQSEIDLRVFFTWHAGSKAVHDPGFGREIFWDIPLTEGYEFQLAEPSSTTRRRTFWNMDSPDLITQLEDFDPSAVLVLGWNFRSHIRVMRHYHGKVPVLFRGDSTLLDVTPGIKSQIRSWILHYVYRHVDFALPVGSQSQQYFLKYGLNEQQLVVVPHAIDNQRFAGADGEYERDAELLRHELGFADSDVVILFAGKFEPKKNPLGLVRAFLAAASQRANLRLLLVGNGMLEEKLQQEVAGHNSIRILPFQNQQRMPVIYRVGDIVCLPSRYKETWGLCLNEAMACGRPIMGTSKVGATYDLLVEGRTGYHCPDLSSIDAAQALIDLPQRDVLQNEMGPVCQRMIQDWSFQRIVESLTGLLRRIDRPLVAVTERNRS